MRPVVLLLSAGLISPIEFSSALLIQLAALLMVGSSNYGQWLYCELGDGVESGLQLLRYLKGSLFGKGAAAEHWIVEQVAGLRK
jgi:hypothetical protein